MELKLKFPSIFWVRGKTNHDDTVYITSTGHSSAGVYKVKITCGKRMVALPVTRNRVPLNQHTVAMGDMTSQQLLDACEAVAEEDHQQWMLRHVKVEATPPFKK